MSSRKKCIDIPSPKTEQKPNCIHSCNNCGHKKKITNYLCTNEQKIDVNVATIAKYLYLNHIIISDACEDDAVLGYPGYVRINFNHSDDADTFIDTVLFDLDESDDMYIRAMCNNRNIPNAWVNTVQYERPKDTRGVVLNLSVRFPNIDCQYILFILKHCYTFNTDDPEENLYEIDDNDKKTTECEPIILNETIDVSSEKKFNEICWAPMYLNGLCWKNSRENKRQIYASFKKCSLIKEEYIKRISKLLRERHFDEIYYRDIIHRLNRIDRIDNIVFSPERHSTIRLLNPKIKEYIDIDKGISSLIESLWLNDISTVNSCENNNPNNFVWIEFYSSDDLEKFISIVFTDANEDEEIYERAFYPSRTDRWYYDIFSLHIPDGNPPVCVCISLQFPQKDYDFIVKKLKDNLKNKGIPCKSLVHIDDISGEKLLINHANLNERR